MSNKNVIKNLNFGLRTGTNLNFKKKLSQKTESSSKKNDKIKNKTRDKIEKPLFLRTQVKDKKYNKYYSPNIKKKF